MKTAQQIIGLPVVSIFDGNEIGKVKSIIINASKGTIDFFVIDSGIRSLAGGVIPAERVLGIGEYALTIQQPDDISDIVKIPEAIELMQKNITVHGTRVLTRKGNLLGEAGDIFFNEEDTYNITGVEFLPASSDLKSGIIPRSCIITFGKNLLVVQDDFIDQLIETPSAIRTDIADEKKNIASFESAPAPETDYYEPSEPEQEQETAEPVEAPVEPETAEPGGESLNIEDISSDSSLQIPFESSAEEAAAELEAGNSYQETEEKQPEPEQHLSAAELFEQRQRQYLLGKKVTKTIYNSSGGIIVNSGETITEQVIDEVKANGKLIELVMNYEE